MLKSHLKMKRCLPFEAFTPARGTYSMTRTVTVSLSNGKRIPVVIQHALTQQKPPARK